jgi:hypothetical protein
MSKNREVYCTVINKSGYDLTFIDCSSSGAFSNDHGDFKDYPVSTIKNNTTAQPAFCIEKSDGVDGSTGWVSYNLNNGQGSIIFMFNNPYSYDGDGSSGNCWFYAVIQGSDPSSPYGAGSVGVPLNVYTTISGYTINPTDPDNQDNMDVTVTVNSTFNS